MNGLRQLAWCLLGAAMVGVPGCFSTEPDSAALVRRYEDFRGAEQDERAYRQIKAGLSANENLSKPLAERLEAQLLDILQRHPCHLGVLRCLQDVRMRGDLEQPLLMDLPLDLCEQATALYLIARGTDEMELARKNLDLALSIHPDFPHARALRGLLELSSGEKMGRAIRDLEAGHQAFPDETDLLLALAEAHERRFDPAGALPVYRELLARDPGDRDVRMNLGLALLELGEWRDAEVQFRQVVEQHREYADGYHALGAAMILGQEWREAERHYSRMRQLFPDDAEVLFSLGGLYFDGPLRDRIRSEESYRAFLAALEATGTSSPNHRAALTYLADLERDGRTPLSVEPVTR